jgi:PAS domain-containing protein
MPKGDVEIILLKQLASCLAMPMLVLGPEGDVLFFNESSEPLLGLRFEETGELTVEEWGDVLQTTNAAGERLTDEERPLVVALSTGEPAHKRLFIRPRDGTRREIEATAIPLVGQQGQLLGALGLFWQLGSTSPQPLGDAPLESTGQHEVEAILTRRLASLLATPIFLQDAGGHLLYFNRAAEPILGWSFEELRTTPRSDGDLYNTFKPMSEDREPIKTEDHPLTIARVQRIPAHLRFFIDGLDGVVRKIATTAIPLIGQGGRNLGAVGFFWEIGES